MKGFTLIELLVVVLIIGILAAVAVPQYERAVARTRLAEKNIFLSNLWKAQQVYYLANDAYATRLEDLPIEVPGYTCLPERFWDCTGPYGRMLFESHMGRVRLSLYKKDGYSFLGLNYADGSHFCEPGTQYKHRDYICELWNNFQ